MSKSVKLSRNASIVHANWFQFGPHQKFWNKDVHSRMLVWSKHGRGRIKANGTWYELEADHFFFLPWRHSVFYEPDKRQPFGTGAIHILPDLPNFKEQFIPADKDWDHSSSLARDAAWPGLEGVRYGEAGPSHSLRLLATYIVESFPRIRHSEKAVRPLARLLVEEISLALVQLESTKGNEIVRRAQEFIETQLEFKMALPDLAKWVGCSLSSMQRQFHTVLGVPPYEYILERRILRAQHLLTTTPMRVKEVAARVGFEDAFQFSRIFAKRVGRSPRHFREAAAFHPFRLKEQD